MKKVGFIGAYDKTDFVIYIAKILAEMGKRVLVIDATIMQRARYIVPVISPARKYITEFEEIDVAVGFENFGDINGYLGRPANAVMDYDMVLVDTDSLKGLDSFGLETADRNYFITSSNLFSLKRGLEILTRVNDTVKLTKVLFSSNASKQEDEYINFLSLGYKIVWDEERIYFPLEQGDETTIIENQIVSKIKFRNLSKQYKEGLLYITEQLLENPNMAQLRKVFR